MADGKVVINTALDNSGFKKGISSVGGSLGGIKSVACKLGAAIGFAFSVKAIMDFGATSIKAATELQNAMTGLESITEGQGRSFSKAQGFIGSYVADGLVPATDAITTYKNLAMRGYDDGQIQSTMEALKDSAAFGRQASLTMGAAISSASEGLRNENSILVDNAGVTKNVAKMWDEYAKSIGTTAQNLTKQQKIQAEVNGILQESRFQVGDAAKVANTYSGQLMQLSFNFNKLKVTIGNAIIPIAQKIIPIINVIITCLTKLASTFASVMSAIFGTPTKQIEASKAAAAGVGTAIDNSIKNQNELTNATKETAKAQQSLGIDELNIVGAEKSAGGASGGGSSSFDEGKIDEPVKTETPYELAQIEKFITHLNTVFEPSVKAWGTAFENLKAPVQNAFSVMGASANGLMENALKPLGSFIISEFIPDITNSFSETFAPIFEDVAGAAVSQFSLDFQLACLLIESTTNDLVLPVAGTFKQAFLDVFKAIKDKWGEFGNSIVSKWEAMKEGIRNVWESIYNIVLRPIFESIAKTIDWIWNDHLKVFWDNIVLCVASITEMVLALWNSSILPFVRSMTNIFGPIIANAISFVVESFGTAIAVISDVVGGIIKVISGLAQFITGVFTGDWTKAWQGIKDIFLGVWDSIAGILKGTINGIIDMINALIRGVTSGINGIIGLINGINFDIPKWVPVFGGSSFGLNIPSISAPQIPKLAQGAVIPANRKFLAVLGDQKNGTNIEAPLSTIEEAVRNALAQQGGTVQSFTAEQPIEIMLDGNVLYTAMVHIKANRGAEIGGVFTNEY